MGHATLVFGSVTAVLTVLFVICQFAFYFCWGIWKLSFNYACRRRCFVIIIFGLLIMIIDRTGDAMDGLFFSFYYNSSIIYNIGSKNNDTFGSCRLGQI